MLNNRRWKDGFQYTVPSPSSYPYQWMWDSCFHAIILSHFNTDDAKKELLSLVSRQFENGLIPHMLYWERTNVMNIDWGREGTSSITQPPIIAHAVWKIFKKDNDVKFLKKIYPHLYRYYHHLLTERDPRQNHLVGIINPDESGEDNSPRFDIPLGLPSAHTIEDGAKKRRALFEKNKLCNFDAPDCMKNFFWIKDVPFNTLLIENLRVLCDIAETLGNKNDKKYFREQEIFVTEAMRKHMKEDCFYWSVYGEDYKKIRIKTWSILAPLYAKLLTQEEAEILVENYLFNPNEFLTSFSVPTVSKSESSYDPEGFWRGPVWISINWIIYHGLSRYGFIDAAEKIKESSMALIEKSGFREHFNPETGGGLGAKDFTWGALIVDMIDDEQ